MLSFVYVFLFRPEQPTWLLILFGSLVAVAIAILANIMSAFLVRKHLIKLQVLRQELLNLSNQS